MLVGWYCIQIAVYFAAWYFDCSIIRSIIAIENEAIIIGWVELGGLARVSDVCAAAAARPAGAARIDAAYNADIVQSTPFREFQTSLT